MEGPDAEQAPEPQIHSDIRTSVIFTDDGGITEPR